MARIDRERSTRLLSAPAHAQFGELRHDHLAMRRRADLLVDVQNASVETDKKRPARREGLIVVNHAVRGGDRTGRIAQQGVVDAERPRERLVGFGRVDADRKMRDVEAPNLIATLTE